MIILVTYRVVLVRSISSYSPFGPTLTSSKYVCTFLGRLKARGIVFSSRSHRGPNGPLWAALWEKSL
jgi:hypothetical protein